MGLFVKFWYVEMDVKIDGSWSKATANLEKGILSSWSEVLDALKEHDPRIEDAQITSIKEIK